MKICAERFRDKYGREAVCDQPAKHTGGHIGVDGIVVVYQHAGYCLRCLGRGIVGEPGIPLFASAMTERCSACKGTGKANNG